ncbi:hypothetical protein ALI22I_27990 [Saccharothrix sp. ALI-22-I]|nr:hypothetical protein ALI22I_27990 [Saccharothrix sp. ALI-22-I]
MARRPGGTLSASRTGRTAAKPVRGAPTDLALSASSTRRRQAVSCSDADSAALRASSARSAVRTPRPMRLLAKTTRASARNLSTSSRRAEARATARSPSTRASSGARQRKRQAGTTSVLTSTSACASPLAATM